MRPHGHGHDDGMMPWHNGVEGRPQPATRTKKGAEMKSEAAQGTAKDAQEIRTRHLRHLFRGAKVAKEGRTPEKSPKQIGTCESRLAKCKKISVTLIDR